MKGTFVLIPSVEEQAALGMTDRIEPSVPPVAEIPVWLPPVPNAFRPRPPIGVARNMRIENGRLVADIETDDAFDAALCPVSSVAETTGEPVLWAIEMHPLPRTKLDA